MSSDTTILLWTAASIGFVHTILGPDHYLPFIVMSKARKWNLTKTTAIAFLCGLGHILSSVVLGLIGISFGIAVSRLEFIESSRGELAAWFLIAFGFTYFIWGLRRVIRNRPHQHQHHHEGGIKHAHPHRHITKHTHIHDAKNPTNLTPWILFTIFVFGPCEPLIPILMYPAAKGSIQAAVAVALVFGLVTISTMLAMVIACSQGLSKLPLGRLEQYSHALAGLVIFLSGSAIKFLGL